MKTGTHIHDAIDSKRIMSIVVISLVPALLFGMYNVGYFLNFLLLPLSYDELNTQTDNV